MSWESLPQDVLSEGDLATRPTAPRGGWTWLETASIRTDGQLNWSPILENSSGPNAESRLPVDRGGADEPLAGAAEPVAPPLVCKDCRKANSDCGGSPLGVEDVDGVVVALAAVGFAAVDVLVVADEVLELTALATAACDPLLPSFDSRLVNSEAIVFVELLLEREFQL